MNERYCDKRARSGRRQSTIAVVVISQVTRYRAVPLRAKAERRWPSGFRQFFLFETLFRT
jgi:hypothetical protein